MRYGIIIEKALSNYSAYCPDLPGCVATGNTMEEIKKEMADAISFHLEGLREENLPIPLPLSVTDYIEAS